MNDEDVALIVIAVLAVIFGAYCMWLGYDSTLPTVIVGLLSTLAGFIIGKKSAEIGE